MTKFTYKNCSLDTNEKFGRFVVAARDINAGELLLSELPVVCGPYWDVKASCCLNCYAPSDTMCKKCEIVPLCWNCYDNHASIECETLKKLQLPTTFLLDNFDVVTPLRVLLLFYRYAEQKKMNSCVDADLKSQIDEILNMESHCVERKDSWIWKQHAKNAIEPLRKINIDDIFASMDAPWCLTNEFLQKICGILDVNTFEVRTQHFEEFPVRGLYAQAALLAHDCIGNTFITVDNNQLLKVYASIAIKSGEIIYNNYTASLYGTEVRQEHLIKGKYFECQCRRCMDPTELNTHLSSIRCESCTLGYMIRLNCKTTWKCLNCNATVPHEQIQLILRECRQQLQQIDPSTEHYEAFEALNTLIAKYTPLLHSNHYLLIEMKQKLAAIIRHMNANALDGTTNNSSKCSSKGQKPDDHRKNRPLSHPTVSLLERKIELCKEFVPLLDILQPGISRLKAIVLYEQFGPLVQLAKLYHQQKVIGDAETLRQLNEAEMMVKEAIRMLLYEPATNPEGMLAKQAMFELKELRSMRQRIEKSMKRKQ